jgi:hypothetical protein
MMSYQAKRLKVNDRVVWSKPGSPDTPGEVVKKWYNSIWIKWEDVLEPVLHYADLMPYVFTPAQLKEIETEKEMAVKLQEMKKEDLKKPYKQHI